MKIPDDEFDLDVAGALEGTDKSSAVRWSWDYLRSYQALFSEWRHKEVNLVEIGVANGESLRLWELYFSRATIVGIDINPSCTKFARDRVVIEIGSQEDQGFLQRVCSEHPPTIVIDDGSHQAHHIVYTFEQVFPRILPGGIYIVEDLAFHFEPHAKAWRGNGSVSIPEYFGKLARSCMARRVEGSKKVESEREIFESIDSITFLRGAAVIRKKYTYEFAKAARFAAHFMDKYGPSPNYDSRLAGFILRHDGPLDVAEASARRAVKVGGQRPQYVLALADVLQRQGRIDEVVALLRSASESGNVNADLWRRLGTIEGQVGQFAAAVTALESAAALRPNHQGISNELSHAYEQAGDLSRALTTAEAVVEATPGMRKDAPLKQRIIALRGKLRQL